eukprot:2913136-Rhodomonas_salina.1
MPRGACGAVLGMGCAKDMVGCCTAQAGCWWSMLQIATQGKTWYPSVYQQLGYACLVSPHSISVSDFA